MHLASHANDLYHYFSELISTLHDKGTTVYLVSGGFRCIIEYFANYLAIPTTNIYANRLLFNEEGISIMRDGAYIKLASKQISYGRGAGSRKKREREGGGGGHWTRP